ncbi:glycosyltransferase [Tessaracoccus rhinocerotis]|uniref:glycosyltransferase n=1 Tax=Tessaracoccus rhinocerotis TaxID=1689449 RepID=UPI001C8F6E5A|nr:glycosyltransferase [Tessaracoccus rhinocerotis]
MADARLHRSAAALRRAGAVVEVHGLGDGTQGPPGCRVTTAPHTGKVGRLLRALTWPFRAEGDVLVTIDPDTSPAALLAARLRRRRWVADVHEDYAALLEDRAWVPRPLLKVLQVAVGAMNALIGCADLVLVADEHVPPRQARNRQVMRNEPDFSLLPSLVQAVDGSPWRAVYIGDNRTSRGLRTMLEAVAATAGDPEPWQLDLVGPVSESDREWFERRLAEPDCALVTAHGRRDPQTSWEIAAGADVGLCLLENTPAFAEAMPSKVYEYLACGMPTVATPLPRVVELLHRTGAGVVVDSAAETTATLRRFTTDAPWRADLREAAREAGEVARTRRNTYDEAAKRILALR